MHVLVNKLTFCLMYEQFGQGGTSTISSKKVLSDKFLSNMTYPDGAMLFCPFWSARECLFYVLIGYRDVESLQALQRFSETSTCSPKC